MYVSPMGVSGGLCAKGVQKSRPKFRDFSIFCNYLLHIYQGTNHMRLTKSKLRQLIKEELRIIKENIGAGSIEEDLKEIIGEFQETLDGVFSNEIIAAADLARLHAILRSLKTVVGDIYQGEYDKDTQTEDPNKTHSNF
jgi:hypothetical protein